MAQPILVYGHPAAGKSYACKNLDPESTVILDIDCKKGLPWRGFKKYFNAEKKNFIPIQRLDSICKSIKTIAEEDEYKHIKVIVVDGLNNALVREQVFYDEWFKPKNGFEKYNELARKTLLLINIIQNLREDLAVIITAHVETADPNAVNDVDHLLTPGKQLKERFKIEGNFLYVFYAKVDGEGNHFFETEPLNSTARSPEDAFPQRIPNDYKLILDTIKAYEYGEDVNGEYNS